MVCKELVQLPSVIDEKTVDQAFLDKLAFCLRFLKKLLGSLSKDVQSIENDGSLLQAVASFTDAFPKLFKVFVEKKKTKELFGGSSSSWINGLEAGGDDFVETVIRYILSDTMHVMTKRFHEMMVNMDKNAQLDAFRDALQNRSDITLEILVALSKEGNMESLSLALVEGFLNLVQLSFGKGSVFQNVQACVSAFIVNNLDASVWRYDASSCNLLPPLAYTVSSQALFSTRLWKHESLDSTPGELQSRRHLSVRGKSATLPSITDKDWEDIKFGLDNQVDFYAVSFVYYRVVHELKNYLKTCSADISMKNLPSIISACEGTMVAYGDLGAELPIEEVDKVIHWHLESWITNCEVHISAVGMGAQDAVMEIQMTDARCSRCSQIKVGLRDIILAGHGDRYQKSHASPHLVLGASSSFQPTLSPPSSPQVEVLALPSSPEVEVLAPPSSPELPV
ncbi:hypothetical protein AALP_AA4G199800 [Arabis alpina]|uniref:pyruvate kinase n=1 Tax=Arabis alpina TaxID=50452 RepID=A0A087H4F1_ARAAL|nr:hypothetical protein AALP_AA4G199800 [Arabis alpina]